jgi:DNA ligase (NAD+)
MGYDNNKKVIFNSMNKDIKQKVEQLHKQINDLRYKYHVLNDPEVTDKMYEGLMDELRKIEEKDPKYITKDSPTQRIAGKPLDKFEKRTHEVPQWSFDDAFNIDDLKKWEERNHKFLEKKLGYTPDDIEYIVELKIDGLHIVLSYEHGILKYASTRGDGKVGEDVTQNVRTIQTVPLQLNEPISIIVEGEAWLSEKMLETLNKKREKQGIPLFANPRNAAAGTIRQLDSKVVSERNLSLTVYDISRVSGTIDEKSIDTQEHELVALKHLGFLTDSHWRVCKNVDQIMNMYKEWTGMQRSQPFWVDGLVVKVNQREYQDLLGYTGKSPRWGIAMKFPAEQATTKIIDIYFQVGRTGAITPVAHMEPVSLAGTTVTHATLHNFDEIDRLGVMIGDNVVVEKAGDIIPKVIRVLDKMRTGKEKKVIPPETCPICNANVKRRSIQEKEKQSAAYFCTNKKCYSQQIRQISHFVSKKAMNIDGLGKSIVEQLVSKGLIENVADLYTLTIGDISPLEGFGDKSATNIIESIEKSKSVLLQKFLFALGIHHVGEETAVILAEYFESLENILQADKEEFETLHDVGPRVAASLFEYFHDEEKKELVDNLIKNGIVIKQVYKKSNIKNKKYEGKTFVITGSFEGVSRDEIKENIRQLGGKVSGSVSKNTDYVLAGEKAGSKLKKAEDLGIDIVGIDILKLTE